MKFTFLLILITYLMSSIAMAMPPQVKFMQDAVSNVPGVTANYVGNQNFSSEDISTLQETYYTGDYADLPIAMLNRTNGNLEKEILIFVDFNISRDELGLKGLEFLSWWVRDLSRSGQNLQIRSLGLPPVAGDKTQLGKTLRFHIEAYITTDEEDMEQVLKEIDSLGKSLSESLKIYKNAFN